MKKNLIYKKELIALFIFAVLIAIFYGNTLNNGFVHDDIGQVVDNEYVHSLRYLPKVVTGCIWEYVFGGCKDRTTYYRPIHSLSYLLTYQISSSAWIFHLVNLLYFLAAVFLVFILGKTITKNFIFSFIAALLFLIHPINNEVVNWIAAVPELTYTIFILLSTIFYFKYRQSFSNKKLYFSYLFYFLGILSKEPAVFLPAVFLFVDLSFFKIKPKELLKIDELKKYSVFLGLFLIYFLMRATVIGGLGRGGEYYGKFHFSERVYAFFTLFSQYLEKLFYPQPLIMFHPFEKSSNFFSSQFLISFVITLLFFTLIYFLIKKNKHLLSFSLIWLFVFLSPVLIFLNSVGENVFSERYVFASSIGFVFIIAYFFTYFWQKEKKTIKIFLLILMILVGISSFYVIYPRNKLWKNNMELYTATLLQNPDANPIRYNLAVVLRQKGYLEEAKIHWEELIQKHNDWIDISRAYNNLGDYWRQKNDLDKAVEYYQLAAESSIKNGDYKGYNNLGGAYLEKGEYLLALISFCKSLQIDPQAKEPKYNFDRIVSIIESVDESGLVELYRNITINEAFKESKEKRIRYKGSRCADNYCSYEFSSQIKETEIMFPFLIMAAVSPDRVIKIENYSFNPNVQEIILVLDQKYNDETITFIFPTCNGIYYKVETK